MTDIKDVITAWREADAIARKAETELVHAVDAYIAERGPEVPDRLFADAGRARAKASPHAQALKHFKLDQPG